MKRRQLIMGGLAAVAAAGALPAHAGGRHDHDRNRDHRDDSRDEHHACIVGSWFGTVDGLLNGVPIGAFNDLLSIHGDGVVTESRRYVVAKSPVGPLIETTGHGAWKPQSDGTVELFFRVIMQRENGAHFGTDNIRLFLTHDRATDTLSGTFESEIRDLNESVLMSFTGTYSASRISV